MAVPTIGTFRHALDVTNALHLAQIASAHAVKEVLGGRSLSAVMPETRSKLAADTPVGLVQELVYGTLRFHGEFKGWIRLLAHRPLSSPTVEALIEVALYQLFHIETPAHIVVDNAVRAAMAIHPATQGLVNALLRNALRRQQEIKAALQAEAEARYSYPRWWIDKIEAQYRSSTEAILLAGNARPPMTLRVNLQRQTLAGYAERLAALGFEAQAFPPAALKLVRPVDIKQLPGFAEGDVSVQDLGAQWAARLLDLKGGHEVLDACSAPGGKAGHLLELADIALTAWDKDPARLEAVKANLERLHVSAHIEAFDASEAPALSPAPRHDRILADVPCTGSGVVRRHPDIKWLRRSHDIAGFVAQQSAILDACWNRLKIGGKLLYVTCSVFQEENQDQMAAFCQRHADARLLPLDGFPGAEGQLLPSADHDGFYYALLERR